MTTTNEVPKLLVVDDENDVCEFVKYVATKAGYDVISIDDPCIFEEKYSDEISIIVLDITMPEMDGVELIRYLSTVNSKAGLILMSGFDAGVLHSTKELAVGRGLNVHGVLEKPIMIADLESLLCRRNENKDKPADEVAVCVPVSVDELRQAIKNDQIINYYQPLVDMQSSFVICMEALVRWQHPTKGMILPDDFIGLAEDSDLILELTYKIIDKALKDCARWKSEGIIMQVAVNISIKALIDLNFPDYLQAKLNENSLDPSQLIIEMTETAFSDDISHVLDIMTRIRMKGIHLSIDDFGTGYSSIQMLHRGPFDELKIDRTFICGVVNDQGADLIVETTINFSKKMKMSVVAEGVETQEVWDYLVKNGCEKAQGYFISRPVAADEIPNWLIEWELKQLMALCA